MLTSFVRKTAYGFAGFIIVIAVLVSVVRILSPVLNQHRPEIEKWASQLLHMPVQIQKIELSWYRYQPEVSLDAVTLLDAETYEPLLQIKKVRVFFSIWQSLWQRQIVVNGILLSGSEVHLRETETGEILLKGFPAIGPFKQSTLTGQAKGIDVIGFILTEPKVILQNIEIFYQRANDQHYAFTLYDLNFRNSRNQHTISGRATLHQEVPTALTVAIKWTGAAIDLSKIKAQIYLYVSGVSLPQWLKEFTWQRYHILEGMISAKIWAEWNAGAFKQIQTTLESYDVKIRSDIDNVVHSINRLSGNIGYKQTQKGVILAGNDLLIDLPQHLWPVTSFFVLLDKNNDNVLNPRIIRISYLDLADIKPFLLSTGLLTAEQKTLINALQLTGSLQENTIKFQNNWQDWREVAFASTLKQVSFAPYQSYPGLQNFSGEINWNQKTGKLIVNSSRLLFQYEKMFLHPIAIDQLTGEMAIAIDANNNWIFTSPLMHFLNNDAAGNLSGTVKLLANASPYVDLNVNLTMQKVSRLKRYLPSNAFSDNLGEWLQQAFLSGEIKSAQAILRGSLSDFPFDQGNGVFSVNAVLNNIDLHFAESWPALQHINGKLTFNAREMQIDAGSAEILDVPITKIHAVLPNIGVDDSPLLQVSSAPIKTDFKKALKLIKQSPLNDLFGGMFKNTEITGPLLLSLNLKVPVKDPQNIKVSGDLSLQENTLNLLPWQLSINNLNGDIHFTEATVSANNLKGNFLNQNINFNLATIKTNENSVIQATFTHLVNLSDWESKFKMPVSKVVSGETPVNIQIDISRNAPLQIHLSSKLVGVTIDLPNEFGKKSEDERNFSADIFITDNDPLKIKLLYGDLLNAALILNQNNKTFSLQGITLHLGKGDADWPKEAGLFISGDFSILDWDKIKSYLDQSAGTSFSAIKLKDIHITAATLNLFGQSINNVRLDIIPRENAWDIAIASPAVEGRLQVPSKLTNTGQILANFRRLNLHSSSVSGTVPAIEVGTMPAISLNANNVSYNNIPLGRVIFRASPAGGGMNIGELSVTSSNMRIQSSGSWSRANVTSLRGEATTAQLSTWLTSIGIDAHNLIAQTGRLGFQLSWQGAPVAPDLATLNGEATLQVGPGRILDVGEAGNSKMGIGKMLSIFSLQALPRRLSLDFSDVFEKGYAFDSIQGDFNLDKGNAFTNDFTIKGPMASVVARGRIGFKARDVNLRLSITAYIASALPVAATLLAAQPLVGLAAMAVGTVIGSASSKVNTYNYTVRGSWDNPIWTSTNGQ